MSSLRILHVPFVVLFSKWITTVELATLKRFLATIAANQHVVRVLLTPTLLHARLRRLGVHTLHNYQSDTDANEALSIFSNSEDL